METKTNPTDDTALLKKLNEAAAARNESEKEFVSRSKAVGLLLLEAKKLHPAVKDFETFLKKVHGLSLSWAYDCLRIAGGRVTEEELRRDATDRQRKSRANKKKKLPRPAPALKKPEPEPDSVTVTESASAEISIDERKAQHAALDQDAEEGAEKPQDEYADWLDAGAKAEKESARCLAEFTIACRTWLPKLTEQSHRDKARQLVFKMTEPLKAEAA